MNQEQLNIIKTVIKNFLMQNKIQDNGLSKLVDKLSEERLAPAFFDLLSTLLLRRQDQMKKNHMNLVAIYDALFTYMRYCMRLETNLNLEKDVVTLLDKSISQLKRITDTQQHLSLTNSNENKTDKEKLTKRESLKSALNIPYHKPKSGIADPLLGKKSTDQEDFEVYLSKLTAETEKSMNNLEKNKLFTEQPSTSKRQPLFPTEVNAEAHEIEEYRIKTIPVMPQEYVIAFAKVAMRELINTTSDKQFDEIATSLSTLTGPSAASEEETLRHWQSIEKALSKHDNKVYINWFTSVANDPQILIEQHTASEDNASSSRKRGLDEPVLLPKKKSKLSETHHGINTENPNEAIEAWEKATSSRLKSAFKTQAQANSFFKPNSDIFKSPEPASRNLPSKK